MVHRGGLGLQIILVLFLWVLLVGQSNPLYTSFKKVKQTNLYVSIQQTYFHIICTWHGRRMCDVYEHPIYMISRGIGRSRAGIFTTVAANCSGCE